ncbi:hypothetical protein L0Y59_01145, partial [Candidatus Uhrbacteria bacterium]|nr:hypothetical protein [Candidatus Uhrbacteria bacterium]
VDGDTVITQNVTVYDRAGQAIISASFERTEDAQGEGPLTNVTALMFVSESYFDLLGRLDTTADLGNVTMPAARIVPKPTTTTASTLVTRHMIGYGWSYAQNVDGTVSGRFTDPLGRTKQQWTKARDAAQFKVVDIGHDALGHVVRTRVYKEYLTLEGWEFGDAPPVWPINDMLAAVPCTTQQVWGVRKDEGAVAWEESALSSTGLLREIHRPDPAGNEASTDYHRHFAYNAQGQIIGERLLVVGGETKVFIGRVMEYDMQGRTRRDAVVEGEDSLPDDARALEWDYDVAGQLVSARTRDENEYVLNEVRFEYDGYGQAVNVWENHTDEVDTDGSFKVTTNYSAPA